MLDPPTSLVARGYAEALEEFPADQRSGWLEVSVPAREVRVVGSDEPGVVVAEVEGAALFSRHGDGNRIAFVLSIAFVSNSVECVIWFPGDDS